MRRFLLFIFFVLTFRTFQYFPGFTYVQEFWFGVGMLMLAPSLFLRRTSVAAAEVPFVRYVIVLTLTAPVWSAYAAYIEHGQPLLYGVLATRAIGLLGASVGLFHAVRARIVTVTDIERTLVLLSWSTLGLYLAMRLLLDPSEYLEYGKGFIEDRGYEGYRFSLSMTFIIFGMFYYFFKAFRQRRTVLYLPAMVFFIFVFGDAGGRIFAISSLVSVAYLIFRWSGLRRKIRIATVGLLCLGALFLVLLSIAPEVTEGRLERFRDAFVVVLSGAEVDDPSANARGLQIITALPLVQKHIWMGNGIVSYRWQEDSVAGVLGEYFYPSDIGVLGVLYLYGILGTILFSIQYVFAWQQGSLESAATNNVFRDAVKGFLLYTLISSVFTGYYSQNPEVTCTMIFFLIVSSRKESGRWTARRISRRTASLKGEVTTSLTGQTTTSIHTPRL